MSLPTPTWALGDTLPPKPLQRPAELPPPPKPAAKPVAKVAPKAVSVPAEEMEYETGDEACATSVAVPDEIRVLSQEAFLGDRDFILLTSAALLAQLPKEERVLRTTFVREYLYDFDPLLAAIRVGFLNVRASSQQHSPAMLAARSLMAEPVVQRLIKECMTEAVMGDELEKLTLTMVIREATNHGISGNAAARNGAFKMLLDAIEKNRDRNNEEGRVKGNIMLMPAESTTFETWEAKAKESQKRLKESVRA